MYVRPLGGKAAVRVERVLVMQVGSMQFGGWELRSS